MTVLVAYQQHDSRVDRSKKIGTYIHNLRVFLIIREKISSLDKKKKLSNFLEKSHDRDKIGSMRKMMH